MLTINSVTDLLELPIEKRLADIIFLDFEQLVAMGYDAMEVNISKDHHLYWKLYGWDCDSLLVFSPDIIEVVNEEKT